MSWRQDGFIVVPDPLGPCLLALLIPFPLSVSIPDIYLDNPIPPDIPIAHMRTPTLLPHGNAPTPTLNPNPHPSHVICMNVVPSDR